MSCHKHSIFVILFLFQVACFAQKGKLFPKLEGESLTNKVIMLPEDVQDKYTIIGMAWSKKAEEDLESWFVPVYDLFFDKNTFIPIDYDVNLFFIPMFLG